MKTILIASALLISFFTEDVLTGRWEAAPNAKGNVTGVVFKTDNSFEGYLNKKPFFSGTYTIKDSIFTFKDNGCTNIGVYKILFFSDSDSLRFQPITDSCTNRRQGMERLTMGRVK